jgi:hypothetical protein
MGFVIVIVAVIVGLTAIAAWRRRGRGSDDLLPDQRADLSENILRQRSQNNPGPY